MRVFLDTNVLFSAILFPGSMPDLALKKALALPHKAVTCDYVLDELRRTFARKFPNKVSKLDTFLFLFSLSIEIVKVSYDTNDDTLNIRDSHDKPVLRAAIASKCDVLLTGDKDFLESDVKTPKIMKPKDFYESC